jgi:hypothetical protein
MRHPRTQNDSGQPVLSGPEGRESVAQGVTCPDAFYREPWGNGSPARLHPPPPRTRGRGKGGRGRARKPTANAVGHLLAPPLGLFSASATPVFWSCGFSKSRVAQTSLLDVCERSHAVTLSPSVDGRRVSAVTSHNAGILRGVHPERNEKDPTLRSG